MNGIYAALAFLAFGLFMNWLCEDINVQVTTERTDLGGACPDRRRHR